MPFDLDGDSNGVINLKPKPGPQPASGTVTPVKPVVSGTPDIIITKPKPEPQKPVKLASDDVKTVVPVPADFPPKPFKLKDYGL